MQGNTLQAVVALEPWRQRVGYPSSVTDSDWKPEEHHECEGDILWEGDTKYWHCQGCGYIGWSTSTKHYPVLSPKAFFERCRAFHLQKRRDEGELTEEEISHQMLHVMATALRYAAMKRPDELRKFIEGMARL